MILSKNLKLMKNLQKGLHEIYKGDRIDHTVNGKCSGCGACCSNSLPLTPGEFNKLKQFVTKNKIRPLNQHLLGQSIITGGGQELTIPCPFLDTNQKCIIYNVRPEIRPMICRKYLCSNSYDEMEKCMKDSIGNMITKLEVYFLLEDVFGYS